MNPNYQDSMSIIGPHSLDGPKPPEGIGQGVIFPATPAPEQPAKPETPAQFGIWLKGQFDKLTAKTVDPAYREALEQAVADWNKSLKNQKTA